MKINFQEMIGQIFTSIQEKEHSIVLPSGLTVFVRIVNPTYEISAIQFGDNDDYVPTHEDEVMERILTETPTEAPVSSPEPSSEEVVGMLEQTWKDAPQASYEVVREVLGNA